MAAVHLRRPPRLSADRHTRGDRRQSPWIDTIESLLTDPRPAAGCWLDGLREAVDGLAAIERPGAILDPARWGGPMSPQWYGAYVRARYPQAS